MAQCAGVSPGCAKPRMRCCLLPFGYGLRLFVDFVVLATVVRTVVCSSVSDWGLMELMVVFGAYLGVLLR